VFGWREERSQPEPTRSVGSLVQQGRSGAIPKKDAGLGRSQKSTERDRTGALPSSPLPHAPISRPSGEFLCFSRIFLRLLRLGNNAAPPGLHASPVGLAPMHRQIMSCPMRFLCPLLPPDPVLSYAPHPARPACAPRPSPLLVAVHPVVVFASAWFCAQLMFFLPHLDSAHSSCFFFASVRFCAQLCFFFCLNTVLRAAALAVLMY
jgi:hypothetical protein